MENFYPPEESQGLTTNESFNFEMNAEGRNEDIKVTRDPLETNVQSFTSGGHSQEPYPAENQVFPAVCPSNLNFGSSKEEVRTNPSKQFIRLYEEVLQREAEKGASKYEADQASGPHSTNQVVSPPERKGGKPINQIKQGFKPKQKKRNAGMFTDEFLAVVTEEAHPYDPEEEFRLIQAGRSKNISYLWRAVQYKLKKESDNYVIGNENYRLHSYNAVNNSGNDARSNIVASSHTVNISAVDTCLDRVIIDIKPDESRCSINANKPDESSCSISTNPHDDVKCDNPKDNEFGIAEFFLGGPASPAVISDEWRDVKYKLKSEFDNHVIGNENYRLHSYNAVNNSGNDARSNIVASSHTVNISAVDTCLDRVIIDIKPDESRCSINAKKPDESSCSISTNPHDDVKCDNPNDNEFGIAEIFLDGPASPAVIRDVWRDAKYKLKSEFDNYVRGNDVYRTQTHGVKPLASKHRIKNITHVKSECGNLHAPLNICYRKSGMYKMSSKVDIAYNTPSILPPPQPPPKNCASHYVAELNNRAIIRSTVISNSSDGGDATNTNKNEVLLSTNDTLNNNDSDSIISSIQLSLCNHSSNHSSSTNTYQILNSNNNSSNTNNISNTNNGIYLCCIPNINNRNLDHDINLTYRRINNTCTNRRHFLAYIRNNTSWQCKRDHVLYLYNSNNNNSSNSNNKSTCSYLCGILNYPNNNSNRYAMAVVHVVVTDGMVCMLFIHECGAMDVTFCNYKEMNVKFKLLSLYYFTEIVNKFPFPKGLTVVYPVASKRGNARVFLSLLSSCPESQGSAWQRLQSPMGDTTTVLSYATDGARPARLRSRSDTAQWLISSLRTLARAKAKVCYVLSAPTQAHQVGRKTILAVLTSKGMRLVFPEPWCNKVWETTVILVTNHNSNLNNTTSNNNINTTNNVRVHDTVQLCNRPPRCFGHPGHTLPNTQSAYVLHGGDSKNNNTANIVIWFDNVTGKLSPHVQSCQHGSNDRTLPNTNNNGSIHSNSSINSNLAYICNNFRWKHNFPHVLPPYRIRLLSAQQRLRRLLLCYRLCKHQQSGFQLYERFNTHYGKEYSSCVEGDGPPIGKMALLDGTEIHTGMEVYVPWSSFPESQEEEWNAHQEHVVMGIYLSQVKNTWTITFPALNVQWNRGKKWIHIYGSTRHVQQDVITRDIYINRSPHSQEAIEPVKKKIKAPNQSVFTPEKGLKVYVPWQSFPESITHPFSQHTNPCAIGIYESKNSQGWLVSFSVLGEDLFPMSWSWIDQWGSNTACDDSFVVRRRDILPPQQTRSYLDALMPDKESDDEIEPARDKIIEIPEIRLDGKWATNPNLTSTNLGIAVLNINKLQEVDVTVGREFWQHGCGITFLIDTRVSNNSEPHLIRRWREMAGDESRMILSPQNPHAGGQAILLDPYWSRRVIKTWTDPSQLAVIFELKLSTSEGVVRIISVYWPVPHMEGTNSLGAQVTRWLALNNRQLTVNEYMLETIRSRLRKPASRHILIGDFNRRHDVIDKFQLELHNAHSGAEFSTFYKGLTPISKIDFILHTGQCLQAGHSVSAEWQHYSDHRPIWAIFSSNGPKPRIKKSALITIRRDFSKQEESDEYQVAMNAEQFTSTNPSDQILNICKAAKQHAHRKVLRKRYSLWTPESAAIIIRQEMVVDLRKLTTFTPTPTRELINLVIQRAQDRTHAIGKDGLRLWLDPEKSLFTNAQLVDHCLNCKDNLLRDETISLRKLMQGRKRRQRLDIIQERVNKIKHDPHRFFRTLGSSQHRLDLSQLVTPEGTLTDPQAIDAALASHFQTAFQDPGIPRDLWDSLTEEEFRNRHPNIPVVHKTSMWAALHSVSEAKRAAVGKALTPEAVTPTRAEFLSAIQAASSDSAGGPTGATYLMLKHLPLATIDILYESIRDGWQSQTLPPWWRTKLLYLLAKKPNDHTIGNIRPIVLLEVTRKLWFKIIGGKVQKALDTVNVLQENQYGFRHGRSTSDNIIQLINTMEAAAGSPLFATSWDIVGAFNAPPRPWLEFSLRRVGVPAELARTLAYLDDQEVNHMLTPFHLQTGNGTTFSAACGCGQGDVTSPLLWNLYFDIVLTALNTTPSGIYYTDDHHNAHLADDTAYADDLLSFSSTLEGIQVKADTMSAAAAILGFHLATHKFRTFAMGAKGQVVLHNHDWVPTVIACSTDGFVRYLGSRFNIDGSYHEEERLLIENLQQALTRIQYKVHRSSHGRDYINRALIPKIQYPAGFGVISAKSQAKLSTALGQAYKSHAHVPASFPAAILNAPTNMGGLGFHDPVDAIATAKWNIIQRVLSGGNTKTKTSLTSILFRHSMHGNTHNFNGRHEVNTATGTWLEDVVHTLSLTKAKLVGFHTLEVNELDTPLVATDTMLDMGIRCLGDIVEERNGPRSISPLALSLPFSSWSTQSPSTSDILFSPDQLWASEEDPSTIHRIIGWSGTLLVAEPWHLNLDKRRGIQRRFAKGTPHIIDPLTLTHKCIAPLNGIHRILKLATRNTGRRREILLTPQHARENCIVATDATYSATDELFPLFSPPSTAGAIVLVEAQYPHALQHAFRFEIPPTAERAYMSELFSMSVALKYYAGTILSDCQSAISTLQKGTSRTVVAQATQAESHRLSWTKSHPERTHLPGAWTGPDHAISKADAVAEGDPTATQLSFPQATTLLLQHSRVWAPIGPQGLLLENPVRVKQLTQLTDYLAQRTKHQRAIWSQPGLHFATSLARTIPQRAAMAKLYLCRYQADIDYDNHRRPKCSCGVNHCRNILTDWLSICQRHTLIEARRQHQQELSQLDIPHPIWTHLGHLLQQPDNVLLYRGHWTASARTSVHEKFRLQSTNQSKVWNVAITKITRLLTTHALQLQHIVSTETITFLQNTPTMVPGHSLFRPTTAAILPVYVEEYATPIHYAALRFPLVHTPVEVAKPQVTRTILQPINTPLKSLLYPPKPSKSKKNKKTPPAPSSTTPTIQPATTTSAPADASSIAALSTSTPSTSSYHRPFKRSRPTFTSVPPAPATILHHFPRLGPEPIRKRQKSATTPQISHSRQLPLKRYLVRVDEPQQHQVKRSNQAHPTLIKECACNCHLSIDSSQTGQLGISYRSGSNSSSSFSSSSSISNVGSNPHTSMSFPFVSPQYRGSSSSSSSRSSSSSSGSSISVSSTILACQVCHHPMPP